ncbi:response regulator [Frateuria edaphi]|uniref:response regulator transcription factor n=1 Tax=Frateuria edaphi TaxID=2898793 RepID=UPI001E2FF0DE|nr:response regulator [Frateuria edaphi]UGB45448.1 response regulator [Frateuria edaphi]
MNSAAPIVFIVDDDISVRESLESLVKFEGWCTRAFATAGDFLAHPREARPSCLILDVTLPDINGLDLQRLIAVDRADMPIIFISGYGDIPMTVRAMRAGAAEFLTKPVEDGILLESIRAAIARSTAALEDVARTRSLREAHASLTRREREVMALVVSGLLNKQIGGQLGISEITVKAHRGRVMQKMRARSVPDLVKMAVVLEHASAPARNDE